MGVKVCEDWKSYKKSLASTNLLYAWGPNYDRSENN